MTVEAFADIEVVLLLCTTGDVGKAPVELIEVEDDIAEETLPSP